MFGGSETKQSSADDTHRSGAASACLWKSSSSSAAVMRPDAGLCLIDAVRGATGVPDMGVPPRKSFINVRSYQKIYF